MKDSILYAALRSFVVSMFSMTGFLLGLIPVILVFTWLFSTVENEPEYNFTAEILPNAHGVRTSKSYDSPVILNINIDGVIGLDGLDQHSVRRLLVESRENTLKNNRVKALFLNIESPGGTVVDADGIYKAVKAYKEQYDVPVYAYVDGLCASGGMYIAAAADKIYASDVSLIGSVGVLSPSFLNFSQLIDKIGVQALTLTAGKGKDELNPLRPWKPGEQDNMQTLINYYYNKFVNIVADNRPALDKTKLVEEYGAKVFPATTAAEYGYIDQSGLSRGEVLSLLLNEIGIADDQYQVVQLNGKTWVESLLTSQSALFTGKVKHEIRLPQEMDLNLHGKFLYLYSP